MNSFSITPKNSQLGNSVAKQTTNTILMIEPVAFGFNNQTAVNNYFQQKEPGYEKDIQAKAYAEFGKMVRKLRANGVNVLVVRDLSLIHISEPTRRTPISYAVFC